MIIEINNYTFHVFFSEDAGYQVYEECQKGKKSIIHVFYIYFKIILCLYERMCMKLENVFNNVPPTKFSCYL